MPLLTKVINYLAKLEVGLVLENVTYMVLDLFCKMGLIDSPSTNKIKKTGPN